MLLGTPFSGWELPSVPHYKGMAFEGAPGNVLQVGPWTLGLPTAPSALFALPNCVFSGDLSGVVLPHFVRILHGASGTYLPGERQEQGG